MKHPTPTVIAIIGVNALLFILTYYIPNNSRVMVETLALHYPTNEDMRLWQFVTHMFMHGSVTHIIFNMIGIYLFGGPLESLWGARRFLTFYLIAGLGAGLIYTGINVFEFSTIHESLMSRGVPASSIQSFIDTGSPDISILSATSVAERESLLRLFNARMLGASGALYGVLVAFATLFPNVKLALIFFPVPIAAKYFVPVLLLIDLFSGITGLSLFGGGIAHFAHIGGAIIGFLLMLYWKDKHKPYHRYYE